MAQKVVRVQLDDELVERLDDLARKTGVSRSELLRRGALAVLEAAEADRELAEAYRRQPQDPSVVAAAEQMAAEVTPAW